MLLEVPVEPWKQFTVRVLRMFGGGAEIWAMGPLAIYTEFEWSGLKGDDRNGGEPTINDKMTLVVAGIRYRLGLGGR